MGAPGALIPAEVPSSQLQNYSFPIRKCADVVGIPNNAHLMLDDGSRMLTVGNTQSEDLLNVGSQTKPDEGNCAGINQTERFEHDLGNLLQSLHKSHESPSYTKASPAEKMQVKNVSKYVLSAAKNPEFAQKLHTVLLESGALPPPDLFSHINTQDAGQDKVTEKFPQVNRKIVENSIQADPDRLLSGYEKSVKPSQGEQVEAQVAGSILTNPLQMNKEQFLEPPLPKAAVSCKRQIGLNFVDDDEDDDDNGLANKVGGAVDNNQLDKDSAMQLNVTANRDRTLYGKSEKVNAVLGEGAEWEIQWEDLHVGERIGIGKISH